MIRVLPPGDDLDQVVLGIVGANIAVSHEMGVANSGVECTTCSSDDVLDSAVHDSSGGVAFATTLVDDLSDGTDASVLTVLDAADMGVTTAVTEEATLPRHTLQFMEDVGLGSGFGCAGCEIVCCEGGMEAETSWHSTGVWGSD